MYVPTPLLTKNAEWEMFSCAAFAANESLREQSVLLMKSAANRRNDFLPFPGII
jgi:hypothetical protein